MDRDETNDMELQVMSGEGDAARGSVVDIMRIMELLPHRYPFLMVDRMVDVVLGQSAIGIKNVTIGEGYFQGHFPHVPMLPGVLVIETMAQTSAVLVTETLGGPEAGPFGVFFMSIEGAKFRRPVGPGDQLRVHVKIDRHRGTVWRFTGVARVDDVAVAEATWTAMVTDRSKQKL
jgi:3-hydroxyacyl-[acyl-carrier-protein] dehydratase